ncbi:hypothetical protein L5515_003291 [Caenorhabditis briggsae]|uniref:Uncharacterized protein n=1 Tax=Caenorhabditis briggsae TaxID=6238 RepID=A0AAE9EIT9_CAEBR|nr:hypothetical protein L5515_003291 [Caenorhabditis briggsae]
MKNFIFSLFLISQISGLSKFHFDGNFGCKLATFCYRIEVYEQDWIEKSDDLLINGPEIVSHIPHKYSIDAQDTSDGVDLERKLEIYMMVHHNCTSNGKQKKLRYFCGKYNIDVWEVKESKDLELFDKGEDV